MRIFKHITFSEGISCTLTEFKKIFAPHLIHLNEAEVKEAHKVATKKDGKLSTGSDKSKIANKAKGK